MLAEDFFKVHKDDEVTPPALNHKYSKKHFNCQIKNHSVRSGQGVVFDKHLKLEHQTYK